MKNLIILFGLQILTNSFAQQNTIDWHGIVGGGGIGAAVGNYQLLGTIGQPVASNPTPDTNPGPNDQASIASGFLSVAVVDTYSMITLISSVNPSGFKDSVLFTAGLPAGATGSLIFKTNNVVFTNMSVLGAATSVSTTLLPRQNDIVAAEYSGDFYHIASSASVIQTVTNHPPAAGMQFLGTSENTPLTIAASALAGFDFDADGDLLKITSVSPSSTAGGSVALSADPLNPAITYNPPTGFYSSDSTAADLFTYVVDDGFGGSTICTVKVTVRPGIATSISIQQPEPGQIVLNGSGHPGYRFDIQYSSDVVHWSCLATVTAAANGFLSYTDNPSAQTGSGFYRWVYPSQH